MAQLTQNGIAGLVYWQDSNLVHAENKWIEYGHRMADKLELLMREGAQVDGDPNAWSNTLCPACYMLIAYNMLVSLSQRTGQSVHELARSLGVLFMELDEHAPPTMEEARVFPYRNALKVYACAPGLPCPVNRGNDCEEETG